MLQKGSKRCAEQTAQDALSIWVIHVMRLFLPTDWWRLAHGSLILAFVDTISNYQLPELPMYGNNPDNLLNTFRAWHMHCMYRPNKAKDAKLLKFFENQRPAWRLRTLLLSWKAHPDTFGAFPSTKCDVCCGWNQMKHAGTHRRSKRDQKSTFFFNMFFFFHFRLLPEFYVNLEDICQYLTATDFQVQRPCSGLVLWRLARYRYQSFSGGACSFPKACRDGSCHSMDAQKR